MVLGKGHSASVCETSALEVVVVVVVVVCVIFLFLSCCVLELQLYGSNGFKSKATLARLHSHTPFDLC